MNRERETLQEQSERIKQETAYEEDANPKTTTNKKRIYKFRVWDNDFKTMLFVNDAKFVDGVMIGAKGVNWDSEVIVMQYTGLLDKNGVEIYEGDILLRNKGSFPWEVQIRDLEDGVVLISDKRNEVSTEYVDGDFSLRECEVIGNIYQNKELLK